MAHYLKPAPIVGVFGRCDVDGVMVPYVRQELGMECGVACIGLVLRMRGIPFAESRTLEVLRWRSRAMGGPGAFDPEGGTGNQNMAAMLQSYGIPRATATSWPNPLIALQDSSLTNPMIASVTWREGGIGHWIVVCGYRSSVLGHDAYLISDPYFGVGWLHLRRRTVGGAVQAHYKPHPEKEGDIDPWLIADFAQ